MRLRGLRRRAGVVVVVGLLVPIVGAASASSAPAAALPRGHKVSASAANPWASTASCGAKDLPETGIAGDVPLADQLSGRADHGYNCGLALVGYSSLGRRGGNANMAWSGDCAYIAGNGVAVVDVHDPTHPRQVGTLHSDGADASVETISAVDAPGRHVLATGKYGLGGATGEPGVAPVDLWDVTDCTHPKHVAEIAFPANVHNLTLTADGKRLWTTLPLQSADISDLRHPKLLPSIEPQIAAAGHFHLEYGHEAWPSADNTRLYLGGQLAPDNQELLVIDTTGWPAKPIHVLGSIAEPGHSIRSMTINGRPYLLNSDESIINPTAKGCLPDLLTPFGGASRPLITDISHPEQPTLAGTISLPINDPINCVEQALSGVNASVHYHDVDDPNHTTFAMLSMWNAGLRIDDVRDPANPREVAYFNPGRFGGNPLGGPVGIGTALGLQSLNGLDQAWAHIRYVASTGQIWLTTATGGFWVLELEPQVRAALGLPAKHELHPNGAIPRPAQTQVQIGTEGASAALTYCALATARIL